MCEGADLVKSEVIANYSPAFLKDEVSLRCNFRLAAVGAVAFYRVHFHAELYAYRYIS